MRPATQPAAVLYETALNDYADAVVFATRALEDRQLSLEGRATITETLARCLSNLNDMNWHRKQGNDAEAQAWAKCAIANAKLAKDQTDNEVSHAHRRPPAYTERM